MSKGIIIRDVLIKDGNRTVNWDFKADSSVRDILQEHGFEWDDYQILQCYMLFGGVPYYLSLLRPYLSLPENVDSLIYRRGGDLSNEFNEL